MKVHITYTASKQISEDSWQPSLWKKLVAENLKEAEPIGNHELYIKNRA